MPSPAQLPSQGFFGGVNLRDSVDRVAPDEALNIVNMILEEQGSATKRRGSTELAAVGNSDDRIISMFHWPRPGATDQIIVHMDDGSLRYTTNETSFTTIQTGLDADAPFSFEAYLDKVYISNGVDDYASWDATTYTTYASAPKGKYLRLWKDAMWVSGVTANPNRVYTSDPGDAETFPALGFVDLDKGDGDVIKGLGVDGSSLIVFKQFRAWSVLDPVEFTNRNTDWEKGCESHFSIISKDGQLFYLSHDGLCIWAGDQPGVIISGKIEPVFSPEVLNYSALETAWGYVHSHRVGWAVPEVGSIVPTLQIEFYPTFQKHPFAFHRMPARCFAHHIDGTVDDLHFGNTKTNGFMRGFSGGTDDGEVFSGLIDTAWLDFDEPDFSKYLRFARIFGSGKFTVGIRTNYDPRAGKSFDIDFASSDDIWGGPGEKWGEEGDTWGGKSKRQEKRFHPDLYGRSFSLRFTDGQETEGSRPLVVANLRRAILSGEWAIYNYILQGIPMGDNL